MENFRKELTILLNSQSKENGSNTPDWVLAKFLEDCLDSFDNAVNLRSEFYNAQRVINANKIKPEPGPYQLKMNQ